MPAAGPHCHSLLGIQHHGSRYCPCRGHSQAQAPPHRSGLSSPAPGLTTLTASSQQNSAQSLLSPCPPQNGTPISAPRGHRRLPGSTARTLPSEPAAPPPHQTCAQRVLPVLPIPPSRAGVLSFRTWTSGLDHCGRTCPRHCRTSGGTAVLYPDDANGTTKL